MQTRLWLHIPVRTKIPREVSVHQKSERERRARPYLRHVYALMLGLNLPHMVSMLSFVDACCDDDISDGSALLTCLHNQLRLLSHPKHTHSQPHCHTITNQTDALRCRRDETTQTQNARRVFVRIVTLRSSSSSCSQWTIP